MGRAQGPDSALPDVLFIGLGDTGRGQMAAALLTFRAEGRVVAHSAGSEVAADLDPAVVQVMDEIGIDLADAYAKPLASEVIAAADLVVTMGRSVGPSRSRTTSDGKTGGSATPPALPSTKCGACATTSIAASRRSSPTSKAAKTRTERDAANLAPWGAGTTSATSARPIQTGSRSEDATSPAT
jgi:Low molecular weight phosphotyrosine protein phosphatase